MRSLRTLQVENNEQHIKLAPCQQLGAILRFSYYAPSLNTFKHRERTKCVHATNDRVKRIVRKYCFIFDMIMLPHTIKILNFVFTIEISRPINITIQLY